MCEQVNSEIQECAELWLGSTKRSVKLSTYAKYSNIVKNHIIPYFDKLEIAAIDSRAIFEFICQCQAGDVALADKSVRDIATVLKALLRFAALNGYPSTCVAEAFQVKSRPPEIEVMTKEEQRILEHTLLRETDFVSLGIYLTLYTGLRIGELCALKWENIDRENGIIQVKKTMQRVQLMDDTALTKTKVIVESPKSSKSIRSIPLPWFLNTRLLEMGEKDRQAYFLTGEAGRFIEPRLCQNRFKKTLAKCGLADTNFHVLRHTFATRCVESGVEIKTLSEILGHTSVNITLNRYVHSSMELKRTNMDKLKPLSM